MCQMDGFTFKKFQRVAFAFVCVCGVQVYASAEESINQDIAADAVLTCLLDTGASAAEPLPDRTVAEKAGWVTLKEDDLAHPFQGDAVLLNDKLAVVLRKNGQGAEVYTLSAAGSSLRATLAPRSAGGGAQGLESLQIIENNPGAVAVRAAFSSGQGKPLAVTYRVTIGQITVQMDPGEGVDLVRVAAQTDYIVAPDFFADDLVYGNRSTKESWAGLPAENFFLHLSGGGAVIVTCIWQTNGRNTRALFSGEGEGDTRAIAGSEIECAPGKLVWAAFTEHPDSWHATTLSASKGQEDFALNWKPPFPAKWRGNFVTTSEAARSWNFLDARTPDYEAPGLGKMAYPCWFQDGVPFVSLPKAMSLANPNVDVPLVIYPIDRSQATPLDMFVLVDVMRGTLGVGPCQYALDIEGLDAESSPTPALVIEWVEKLFKKKRSDKDAGAIREKLSAMATHVEQVDRRIAQYASFAANLRNPSGAGAPDSNGIQTILADLEACIRDLAPARKSPRRVEELAGQVVNLIGKDDWEERFRPVRDELCAIGNAQDRTLAKCRMALRRLKQRCLTQASTDPGAGEMVKRIDGMLREGG